MTAQPPLPPQTDKHAWPEFPPGLVWLVGAGPGDPGLLTLHGLNALRAADVLIYDALVDTRVLDWARPGAIIEYAGKRGGKPSPKQRDISLRLIELSRDGKRVVRLKGGDPFLFGRGGEEAHALVAAGVPIRVTPGVTAGIGGLAYAGIPATHRDVNQTLTFITGHDHTGAAPGAVNWDALAKGGQVLILYMAMKHLDQIAQKLIDGGRAADEPVAIVMNATLPDQRVLETSLHQAASDAQTHGFGAPAIVCVGRVALMRQTLDWMAQASGVAPRSLDPLGLGKHDQSEAS
ncbi:MAG: uroporphyrinogen-III C-methyltransferase [Neomegalonema sp.]|nr:uroporphyrinogen-III C-methyltransferase [Neomegalonema sp.]